MLVPLLPLRLEEACCPRDRDSLSVTLSLDLSIRLWMRLASIPSISWKCSLRLSWARSWGLILCRFTLWLRPAQPESIKHAGHAAGPCPGGSHCGLPAMPGSLWGSSSGGAAAMLSAPACRPVQPAADQAHRARGSQAATAADALSHHCRGTAWLVRYLGMRLRQQAVADSGAGLCKRPLGSAAVAAWSGCR